MKKLVMQIISLIMLKKYLNILPTPLNDLFNTMYEYFTRQHNDLHVDISLKEGVYKLFSFQGIHIWNHISKKISIDVSYDCFKNLSKNYIKIIITFHIELNNGQPVISFSLCYFLYYQKSSSSENL